MKIYVPEEIDFDRMLAAGCVATIAVLMVLLIVAVVQEMGLGAVFVLIFVAVVFVAVFRFVMKRL